MHLPKLPTVFEKGGETRKAYFTVQARELIAAGWVEKDEGETQAKEIAVQKKKVTRKAKEEEKKLKEKAAEEDKKAAEFKPEIPEPKVVSVDE